MNSVLCFSGDGCMGCSFCDGITYSSNAKKNEWKPTIGDLLKLKEIKQDKKK